jgi:enoyl-CoA hydratase/3-hydroxyacyl-CoA dehydrogenase
MLREKNLYHTSLNPLLINPQRPLPSEIAVVGAGTIGPDIGYYLKNSLPGITLYLVDVAEEPLKNAEKRIAGYVQEAVAKKKLKPANGEAILKNIVYTTDYDRLSGAAGW